MSYGMMTTMSKPNAFLCKACHLTTSQEYSMNCTIEECFILCHVLSLRASVTHGPVFVEVMSWCHVGSQFMFIKFLELKYKFKYILLIQWAGQLSQYSDWLRARRSGDRIPVGARFSAPVQTGPGAHPASCTMGTRSFRGVKSGRGVTLTPHPLLVPWS